jgi:G2/mitotic-specific cyclin-B, other
MKTQLDINEKMRGILIDWMVEVHVKFKLLTETMFLSVNIIDRFLALKPVARNKLQLVGITAILLGAKYEEVYAPEVRDFIHISDKAYSREEILKMERLILATLDFNMSTPTPLHFLRRFSKASRSDSRTHTLSKYLTELTLTEYNMLNHVPSKIAAASVYIARRMTDKAPYWVIALCIVCTIYSV